MHETEFHKKRIEISSSEIFRIDIPGDWEPCSITVRLTPMRYGSRWVQLQVEITREGNVPNNVIIVLAYKMFLPTLTYKAQQINTAHKLYVVSKSKAGIAL